MKLTFLLGSGVSIPAGFPGVQKLTDAVLSGDGIVRHGDTLTGPAQVRRDEQDQAYEDGRRRLSFLNWLKVQACARYAEIPGRYVNYEDLAYLAGQIADDIDYEYENPALISFIRDALIDLEGLFRDKAPTDARQELARLAETSVTYIRRTIVARLREVSYQEKTDYLQFFVEACRDEDVTEIDLFTLNHDTLIEDFLRKELIHDPITITDGLRDIESDKSRRWDYRVYDEPHHNSKLVKVFKLHGTFKCAVWDVTFGPGNCAIVPDCTDRYGRFIGHYTTEPPRNGPVSGSLFLAGTFNKILKYNSSMFLELHHRFYRALDDQDCRDLVPK